LTILTITEEFKKESPDESAVGNVLLKDYFKALSGSMGTLCFFFA